MNCQEPLAVGRAADVVMRPPLKGVSTPIPSVDNSKQLDEILSRQIAALEKRRSILRKNGTERGIEVGGKGEIKETPRIVSDIQVIPPREATSTVVRAQNSGTQVEDDNTGWRMVKSGGRRKKPKEKSKVANKNGDCDQTPNKGGARVRQSMQTKGSDKLPLRRRAPRTAAVAIKGVDDSFSYAAALRSLREKIALPDLDIETSHIRKSANGGIVIEIPGVDKINKAEKLKTKVAEVLGTLARVTRPCIKEEVRLIGFDDSVVIDEVADVIASAGECKVEEVKVGTIRAMSNGSSLSELSAPWGLLLRPPGLGRFGLDGQYPESSCLRRDPLSAINAGGKAMCKPNVRCRSTEVEPVIGVARKAIRP